MQSLMTWYDTSLTYSIKVDIITFNNKKDKLRLIHFKNRYLVIKSGTVILLQHCIHKIKSTLVFLFTESNLLVDNHDLLALLPSHNLCLGKNLSVSCISLDY